ncbi:hypothetical protein N9937_01720 [bacterium]|nr:hypothetical protein [bacterium]
MAVTTHTGIPTEIQAGDTFLLNLTLAGYSAASWKAYITLSGGGNVYRMVSSASGTVHAFSESSATTGSWAAGEYVYQLYVEDLSGNGQRVTLSGVLGFEGFGYGRQRAGSIRILPNIAVQDPDLEYSRKVLASLKAAVEGRAIDGVESYSLGGTSITKMDSAELLRWERIFTKRVKDLEREAKMSAGVGSSRRIQFRF